MQRLESKKKSGLFAHDILRVRCTFAQVLVLLFVKHRSGVGLSCSLQVVWRETLQIN